MDDKTIHKGMFIFAISLSWVMVIMSPTPIIVAVVVTFGLSWLAHSLDALDAEYEVKDESEDE